jgi:SNF2 family DNA or RNA helicase
MSYDIQLEELDENSVQSNQIRNAKIQLWPHQLTILHRCKEYENSKILLNQFSSLRENNSNINETDFLRTQVGIIGDKVGSGKSFVILALIADNDITNFGSTIKSYGNNKVVLCFKERSVNIKTNLLVIPHNLVSQWETYVKAFSDNLKYLVISKMKNVEYLYENEASIPEHDLIIVTQTYYVRVAHFLTSRSFRMQRVIYDEVDNVNLPNCIAIDSNFYWFVTATYPNLLYPRGYTRWNHTQSRHIVYASGLRNSGFVKDLFVDLSNNLANEYVKILIIKNKDEYIESSISLPPVISKMVKCKTPLTINILDGFVDREIIQSLNAGDLASALQRISPSQKSTEDNLVSIQIEKYVRELRNYEIKLETTNQLAFDTQEQRDAEVARLTRKKNDINEKINGIRERIKSSNTCVICYDTIINKTISPCCSHSFCFLCINIWLDRKSACPVCRSQNLQVADLLVVSDDTNIPISDIDDSDVNDAFSKLKNLEIILKQKAVTGKVLIYSSYDMTFNSIIGILETMNIKYAYLKGNESHIRKTIDRYKNEDLNVLLVNSRNYGSGLNLENTSDIIMFHKVDSEAEKQVIGRASRIGRTGPLTVWYLLHDNEFRQ